MTEPTDGIPDPLPADPEPVTSGLEDPGHQQTGLPEGGSPESREPGRPDLGGGDVDDPDPGLVATEELAELVADLRAITEGNETSLQSLDRRVQDLAHQVGVLASNLPPPATPTSGMPAQGAAPSASAPVPSPTVPTAGSAAGGVPASANGDTSGADDEGGEAPTFILYFNEGSLAERNELHELDGWIREILVPTYVIQVSSRQPWCAQWWEHPEAVARLHALWLAWQELTDPKVGGHTGPSVWHRDHLDDAMIRLRSHDGPFQACMIDPKQPRHRRNSLTPTMEYPGSGA